MKKKEKEKSKKRKTRSKHLRLAKVIENASGPGLDADGNIAGLRKNVSLLHKRLSPLKNRESKFRIQSSKVRCAVPLVARSIAHQFPRTAESTSPGDTSPSENEIRNSNKKKSRRKSLLHSSPTTSVTTDSSPGVSEREKKAKSSQNQFDEDINKSSSSQVMHEVAYL